MNHFGRQQRPIVETAHFRLRMPRGAAVFAFLLISAALVGGQMFYARKKLPALQAELAAAKTEAASVFEQLRPLGAPAEGEMEKQTFTGGTRGMWQGTESGFAWTQAYMVSGEFPSIGEGYRQRLQGLGWVSFDDMPPSELQRVFKRGKWIATISGNERWDHPTRTRVRVRLEWDFRHRTDFP